MAGEQQLGPGVAEAPNTPALRIEVMRIVMQSAENMQPHAISHAAAAPMLRGAA